MIFKVIIIKVNQLLPSSLINYKTLHINLFNPFYKIFLIFKCINYFFSIYPYLLQILMRIQLNR